MCLYDSNTSAVCSHADCNTQHPPRQAPNPFHSTVRHEKATSSSKAILPPNASEPPPQISKSIQFDINAIVGNTFNRTFQEEILGVLTSQSNLIVDIKCSHNALNSAILSMRSEISSLRNQMDEIPKCSHKNHPKTKLKYSKPTPIPPQEFISSLTGNQNNFPYKLQLVGQFPSVVYKDRKVGFKVNLLGNSPSEYDSLIQDYSQGHFGLRVRLYAADGFPLEFNSDGDDFVTGHEAKLVNGVAEFGHLSIHENSYQSPGGWFYFVVQPYITKYTKKGHAAAEKSEIRKERMINFGEIRPIVIPFLRVRSKSYLYLKNTRIEIEKA